MTIPIPLWPNKVTRKFRIIQSIAIDKPSTSQGGSFISRHHWNNSACPFAFVETKMNVKNVRCVAGAAFGTRLVVGDMLLPAHVFGGRGSMRLQDIVLCGRDSSGAASALTCRDRCTIFSPFQKRSKMNVAKWSKMNVANLFLFLQITAFGTTKAVLFNSLSLG